MDRERPIMTVDVVCFTLINWQLHVLLTQRSHDPFEGKLSLPGGYIHPQEDADAEAAARRVARDKLALDVNYLEQLQTVSGQSRDPRGWSASVVYLAMIRPTLIKHSQREFYPIMETVLHGLPELAFDHNLIITAALTRLRNKATYSSLPLFFMPPYFTIGQLQQVYEATMGAEIGRSNFRRRIIEQGVIEPTGKIEATSEQHRPGELYRCAVRKLRTFDREVV